MITTKSILALGLMAGVAGAAETEEPAPLGQVVEGVYSHQGFWGGTRLELKAGQYRYWHSSDAKGPGEPEKYPLEGRYQTNGGQVLIVRTNISIWYQEPETTKADGNISWRLWGGSNPPVDFKGTTNTYYHPNTNRWTFMKHRGQTNVWSDHAVKQWKEKKQLYDYGILAPGEENRGPDIIVIKPSAR